MLSAAQNTEYRKSYPWLLAPGAAIFVTVLAFNFLGDGFNRCPRHKKLNASSRNSRISSWSFGPKDKPLRAVDGVSFSIDAGRRPCASWVKAAAAKV